MNPMLRLRHRVERWRRLRRMPRISVEERLFQITRTISYPSLTTAFLSPDRRYRHETTELRFKVWTDSRGAIGLVTNITVDEAHRRQGWALTMVEAVMQLYPGRVWGVESPNAASGALFLKLAQKHPSVVLPPHLDTGFESEYDRRYKTTTGF